MVHRMGERGRWIQPRVGWKKKKTPTVGTKPKHTQRPDPKNTALNQMGLSPNQDPKPNPYPNSFTTAAISPSLHHVMQKPRLLHQPNRSTTATPTTRSSTTATHRPHRHHKLPANITTTIHKPPPPGNKISILAPQWTPWATRSQWRLPRSRQFGSHKRKETQRLSTSRRQQSRRNAATTWTSTATPPALRTLKHR